MNKETAKYNYDYMVEQLKNKNITKKQRTIYTEAVKNMKWYFGF